MRSRSLIVAAFAAVLALAAPASAPADRGLELGFADPLYGSSPDRDLWLDRSVDAGAGVAKLFVGWSSSVGKEPDEPTNPADPLYNFEGLDASVRSADARGLDVLLSPLGAPPWAEGAHRPGSASPGTWKPQPSKLKAFMTALATRYSGSYPDPDGSGSLPRVRDFQLWNEPNLSNYLTPQWKGRKAVGALHYKRMLNAAYKGLHSVNPSNRLVTAGLAPYGDDPGGERTRPLKFWREIFCLKNRDLDAQSQCADKAQFDVFAHHAINTSGPPKQSALNPDDASSGDLGAVKRTLRAAERQHTVSGGKRHDLWITEFWWESDPPSRQGYPLKVQAQYIQETMYLAWKSGYSAAIQLRIRDDRPEAATPGIRVGDGLYFLDGTPKPSLRAFRFPFVADPVRGPKLRLWGKAPTSGRVVIQREAGKRWKTVKRLRAGKTQVFSGKLRLRGHASLRAKAGKATSLDWEVG